MRSSPYYATVHWRRLREACIARDGGMCVVPGCGLRGTHVDHIQTRPFVPYPTEFDVLSNLRLLCRSHDSMAKEQRRGHGGSRRNDGVLRVKGCDAAGRSLDPNHPWNTK